MPTHLNSRSLLIALLGLALWSTGAFAEEPIPAPNLDALEPAVRERMQTARESLVRALEDPDLVGTERAKLYGETGKVFHAHHAFEVAAACYRNAAQFDPDNALWPYLVGYIHQDSGRFEEARAEYERVLELDPGHQYARVRLAQILLAVNELDSAEPIFAEVVDIPAFAATAHEALGKIAAARGDHAGAVGHYLAALELQPDATRLNTPLGLAYRSLREIDKAREYLGKTGQGRIRLHDPMLSEIGKLTVSSEMFITAGAQAIKTGRLADAEQAYRGAIALNPDNPRPHVNLSELLTRRGAYEEAEASAREALRLDPTSFFANFNLGNIYEQQGRFQEAGEFFARALDKDPGSVKANHRYAGVLMKTGRYEEAAVLYKIAAELAPGFAAARYLQVLALVALEKYPEALAVADVAVEAFPDHADLKGALARLLAVSSQDGAATDRSFAIARELFDEEPSAENVETVAMALAAQGRFEEAVGAQLSVIEAATAAGDSAALPHLEYNLGRYRRGLASDRPWRLSEQPGDPPPQEPTREATASDPGNEP